MTVIDLNSRLDRLQSHVNAKRLEQRQQEHARQSQRATDWQKVKTDYPDHADLITAIGKSFGKLKRVRVKAGGETILDSWRYGNG